MKKKPKPARISRWNPIFLFHPLLLVILCFVAYANSLTGSFVWDDQAQLYRNPQIRTLDNIPRAFTTSLWSFMHSQNTTAENSAMDRYYRPIQPTIYMLVYRVGGLSPFPYHLTSLALHCIATILVYVLCLQLGLGSPVGLMAAALFAVHPVHTEAVSWIAGVGELACGIFYIGGLVDLTRYLNTRKPIWLWSSSLCLLVALFSKEMAVTFPLFAFLILMAHKEYRLNAKAVVLTLSPYAVALSIYALCRIGAVGFSLPSSQPQTGTTILDWATLVLWAFGGYLRYSVFPYPLYINHVVPVHFSDRILSTALYATIVGAVLAAIVVYRRRFSDAALWIAGFLVTLIPVMYFTGINAAGAFFAERYLYIPSVAFVVAAAFLLARLDRTRAAVVTCAIGCVFLLLTIQRNHDWNNEERLYSSALQVQPETANISTSLGEVLLQKGDNSGAQKYLESALQYSQDPRFPQTSYENYRIYHGLGLAAARQGKPDEAVTFLQKALDIYPPGDAAYATLGGVLISQGRDTPHAISMLEKAIQLNPVNDLARDYLGVALVNQGQIDKGIQYFREALQINPDLDSAKQHLEATLRARGK